MKRIVMTLFIVVATLLTTGAYAATVIESKDGEGVIQTMWVEGSKMRVDISNDKTYMLLDAKTKKMYVVDPTEKTVMDMSSSLTGKSGSAIKNTYKVKLKKKGNGPVIAGYSTVHFELYVDGNKCSEEYLSQKALNAVKSIEIFDAMSNIGAGKMGGMPSGMMNPCDSAAVALGEAYRKYGFPLRIVDKNGSLDSEVIKISKNRKVPPGGFDLPAGYSVKSIDNMMQEELKKMPPMNEMPQNMDPEEMRRMMQEMMKQMGQQ